MYNHIEGTVKKAEQHSSCEINIHTEHTFKLGIYERAVAVVLFIEQNTYRLNYWSHQNYYRLKGRERIGMRLFSFILVQW